MTHHSRPTCSVADQFCSQAGNFENAHARGICMACGENVCSDCSSIRTRNDERRRECNNCQVSLDGNDEAVMQRLARQAGYDNAAAAGIR